MEKKQEKKRYSASVAEEFCKSHHVDLQNIVHEQIDLSQKPAPFIIEGLAAAFNLIFTTFLRQCDIPLPRIPTIELPDYDLSIEDKKTIRAVLKKYSRQLQQASSDEFLDIAPDKMRLCSLCIFLCETYDYDTNVSQKNKILYGITYVSDRNLNDKDVKDIDSLLYEFKGNLSLSQNLIDLYEKQRKYKMNMGFFSKSQLLQQAQIDFVFRNIAPNMSAKQLKRRLEHYRKIDDRFTINTELVFQKRLEGSDHASCLFDKLLDISYADIIFSYINILYEDSNKNTQTYYQFISELQKDLDISNDIKKELNNIFCETIKKHLTRDIYVNNNREAYYRRNRGYKNINNRTSIPYSQKDIMQLIFLGTKNQKGNYTEEKYAEKGEAENTGISYKDFSNYYNNLKILAKKILFPHLENISDTDFEKYQSGYRFYLKYFNSEKPQPKGNSLKSEIEAVFFFVENVKKYFDYQKNTETKWFNYNSIFVKKWDFIVYSCFIYFHRIKEESQKQQEIPVEDYINKYMEYCHRISNISYPHLQKELLETPNFFKEYLYTDTWLISLEKLLYNLEQITSYVIAELYIPSKSAFSESDENLQILHDIMAFYDYDASIGSYITKDNLNELIEFLTLYLPKKGN